jgi:Ni,Fe-hydrogenase I large subunit
MLREIIESIISENTQPSEVYKQLGKLVEQAYKDFIKGLKGYGYKDLDDYAEYEENNDGEPDPKVEASLMEIASKYAEKLNKMFNYYDIESIIKEVDFLEIKPYVKRGLNEDLLETLLNTICDKYLIMNKNN